MGSERNTTFMPNGETCFIWTALLAIARSTLRMAYNFFLYNLSNIYLINTDTD